MTAPEIGARLKATHHFIVYGDPVAKGRPRATTAGKHVRFYTPPKTIAFEKLVAMAANVPRPMSGPVRVDIRVVKRRPKSRPKYLTKDEWANDGFIWCPVKPDSDNVRKAILDGMKACWGDDAQVCAGWTQKVFAERGGRARVEVWVRELAPDEAREVAP